MTALDARRIARDGLFERYRTDGSRTWLDAAGDSMRPDIPAGSRLLVAFGHGPASIGEVVVFRRGDIVLAHRLVARRTIDGRPMLVPKGDNEALADPPVAPEAIIGVVRDVRLRGGRPAHARLGGPSGAAVARVSWWSGRAGRLGGRIARRSPARIRQAAVGLALALSRVPTRVILALIPRPDRGLRQEGGEDTHGI